ncbi:MAG TPA: hypothetical protein VEC16_07245 [Alphaproteobacteria bacterium]|nr:hypothetical protein [Alphaproteobacteria bacterium]
MANEYVISGTGKNKDLALEDLTKSIEKANKKLEDKTIASLGSPKDSKYTVDCAVEGSIAPDFNKALQKSYDSSKSFEDAEAIAQKGYGKIEFTIKSYTVNNTYSLKDKQAEVLNPVKSTPAGEFGDYNNGLERKILRR